MLEGPCALKGLPGLLVLAFFSWGCGGSKFEGCEAHRSCSTGGTAFGGQGAGAAGARESLAGLGGSESATVGGGLGDPGAGRSGDLGAGNGGLGGWSGSSGGVVGAGASGGQTGTGGSGPPCDLHASPRDEACVLEQAQAIYVSPSGNDEHNGVRGAPVKTFERALSLAAPAKLPIVACSGAYAETLTLTLGAKIYGGFDCNTWASSATPTILKPASGAALIIRGVEAEVVIEGIEFHAESATHPGESSIAAIITSSTHVEIRKGRLVAGDGGDGASASEAAALGRAENGNAAVAGAGGDAKECTCEGGETTRGGSGGNAATSTEALGSGGNGLPPLGEGQGGDAAAASCVGGLGRPGAPGPDATEPEGGVGAKTRGHWSEANGFVPEPGVVGAPGKVGQGGGGGRGGESGGGGGGGCGGCGGKGGAAGAGGGASVALVVIESGVTLPGTRLVVREAGNGGKGARGQAGQLGGFGEDSEAGACDGGDGGQGGDGAAGGGGAGGIAVGILYDGAAPPVTDAGTAWFTHGHPGLGGEGGDATSTTDDGKPGGDSVPILGIAEL